MKLIVPKYYSDFSCLASACSDSCCKGWDIFIDDKTYKKYMALEGPLAERFRECIGVCADGAYFKMSGGRCPFLDSSELCEIIKFHGEEYLSDICRHHPRFYTVLGDIAFGGIGISCEAAAELVLSEKLPHSYIKIANFDRDPEECDEELRDLIMQKKQIIVCIFNDFLLEFKEKLFKTAEVLYELQSEIDGAPITSRSIPAGSYAIENILGLLSGLEYMSSGFAERIGIALLSGEPKLISRSDLTERIFLYLLDRHLPRAAEDGDAIGKGRVVFLLSLLFSLLSESDAQSEPVSQKSDRIGKARIPKAAISAAKLISSELEYSEENTLAIEERVGIISSVLSLLSDT